MRSERLTADEVVQRMRRHWPDAVTDVTCLMIPVFRLSERVAANARHYAIREGLTFAAFEVLLALRSSGRPYQLFPSDLYAAIVISSGGLTKVMSHLQEKKLITRPSNPSDKRVKPVRLSAKGCRLVERVMPELLDSDAGLMAGALSERESRQLTHLVDKLVKHVESV